MLDAHLNTWVCVRRDQPHPHAGRIWRLLTVDQRLLEHCPGSRTRRRLCGSCGPYAGWPDDARGRLLAGTAVGLGSAQPTRIRWADDEVGGCRLSVSHQAIPPLLPTLGATAEDCEAGFPAYY